MYYTIFITAKTIIETQKYFQRSMQSTILL